MFFRLNLAVEVSKPFRDPRKIHWRKFGQAGTEFNIARCINSDKSLFDDLNKIWKCNYPNSNTGHRLSRNSVLSVLLNGGGTQNLIATVTQKLQAHHHFMSAHVIGIFWPETITIEELPRNTEGICRSYIEKRRQPVVLMPWNGTRYPRMSSMWNALEQWRRSTSILENSGGVIAHCRGPTAVARKSGWRARPHIEVYGNHISNTYFRAVEAWKQ